MLFYKVNYATFFVYITFNVSTKAVNNLSSNFKMALKNRLKAVFVVTTTVSLSFLVCALRNPKHRVHW